MAAALQSRNEPSQPSLYPLALMNDFDFGDDVRYPTTRSQFSKPPSPQTQPYSASLSANRAYDSMQGQASRLDGDASRLSTQWAPSSDQWAPAEGQYPVRSTSRQGTRSPDYVSDQQPQEPPRSTISYALPAGAARRVLERYSLDDGSGQRTPSMASNDTKPTIVNGLQDSDLRNQSNSRSNPTGTYDRSASPNPPSTSLRKLSPAPPLRTISPPGSQYPPIMPLSASPTYTPPVAPAHRAYAQHPTYVTQANTMQTYTPIIPPQEEICMECSMRDQDMIDVDVSSPGAWSRASDVAFEELKQRELEDEANGILVDNPSRIRIRGGRLTEQNVKLWLSVNPREPASKQQTLHTYIKSQRALLEAEALAHNRAMQEAKQLDSRMRDAYSQLRRSAYDMGSSSSPADDLGGVRIKPPVSPASPHYQHTHVKSHSREITLLENGMIVEHVDVRKEEKEARERRKRQEKRARKSSKSSVMDVTSIISAHSVGQEGLTPYSRYSQASSGRPTSVLTAPLERPDLPRAFSQASFSDFHSMGSSSPRKTRFFGVRNLSAGWKSQESFAPSGMSGSMVDMHVALQREGNNANRYSASPIDLNTPRRSQIWPPADLEDTIIIAPEQKAKKKKSGFAKIWRIVTGKHDGAGQGDVSQYNEKQEDDLPLAPPPPLSYLVSRGPGADGTPRHASTPSIPSLQSPKFGQQSPGMSPPTAPSSLLPSPASLRRSGDLELAGVHGDGNGNARYDEHDMSKSAQDDSVVHSMNRKSLHSLKSEAESRQQNMSGLLSPPLPHSYTNTLSPNRRPVSVITREKSLPPLPSGEQPARIHPSDIVRPRTFYDSRTLPPGSGPAHDFLPPQAPFRSEDNRRQSFGGTASRPNLGFQSMPVTKPVEFDPPRTFGNKYDEFGASRRSLGRLDNVQEIPPRSASPIPSTKRKSKFGFASLLGKKNDKRESEYMQENVNHQFPSMGYSPYDAQDDATTNGYTTSVSRHSTFSSNAPNPGLRMSVASRKALEELVQQDSEFVAYRYPSSDQRLDLLR